MRRKYTESHNWRLIHSNWDPAGSDGSVLMMMESDIRSWWRSKEKTQCLFALCWRRDIFLSVRKRGYWIALHSIPAPHWVPSHLNTSVMPAPMSNNNHSLEALFFRTISSTTPELNGNVCQHVISLYIIVTFWKWGGDKRMLCQGFQFHMWIPFWKSQWNSWNSAVSVLWTAD